MLVTLNKDDVKTMSSSQLAEMLGYEKKEVNRKIKAMFQEKIDGGKIPPSFDSRGYVVDYHLPELESKMFVAKHDINYLEKITQFWIDKNKQEIQSALSIQGNSSAIVELAKEIVRQDEENKALKQQIEDYKLSTNQATIKQIESVTSGKEYFCAREVGLKGYSRELVEMSNQLNLEIKKTRYPNNHSGEVNAYHIDAINRLKSNLH